MKNIMDRIIATCSILFVYTTTIFSQGNNTSQDWIDQHMASFHQHPIVQVIKQNHIDVLPLIIPVFFLFIFLEWKYAEKINYRFKSSVLNISLGLIERVFDVYFFVGVFFIYNYIEYNFGLLDISSQSLGMWLLCSIVLDFMVYWFHRAGHTINFLWAAHVVHHQCEEFNLTVAFRNGIFPHIFRSAFMVILPFIGFPAEMILICLAVSGIFQFFLHTTTVRKLGVLEYIFMTPSHHRVHHASNHQYLDKNFGGVLIIWDRMMGTFQEEKETVKYGIVKPLKTFNLWKTYFHVWRDLFVAAKQTNSLKTKLIILCGTPENVYRKHVKPKTQKSIKRFKLTRRIAYYLITQLIVTTGMVILLLMYKENISMTNYILAALMIVFSASSFCFMLEGKQWSVDLEKIRLLSIGVGFCFLFNWTILLGFSFVAGSLFWMYFVEGKYVVR